jgi:hypothetical protein
VASYPFLEQVPLDGGFRPKIHGVRMELMGERTAVVDWYVFEVTTGRRQRVDYPADLRTTEGPDMTFPRIWWTADGLRFLALARGPGLRAGYLFLVDAVTGASRIVVEEPVTAGIGFNVFNAGGYGVPSVRVIGGGREAIWSSTRDGWGHLYLVDVQTGRLRQLTRGDWLVRDIVRVDESRRQL